MQLGRLEVILRKRAMPDEYVRLCHNFLVGCFWIKFAPIQPAVHDCLSALIANSSMDFKEEILSKHSQVIQNTIKLLQLQGSDNESLQELVIQNINKTSINCADNLGQTFYKDTHLSEDYIEIGDFLYQIIKSIQSPLSKSILPHKILREPLLSVFYSFIDNEYNCAFDSKKAL